MRNRRAIERFPDVNFCYKGVLYLVILEALLVFLEDLFFRIQI